MRFLCFLGTREAECVSVQGNDEGIDAVASVRVDQINISLLNKDQHRDVEAIVHLGKQRYPLTATATVLAGDPSDENSFESPERLCPERGDPSVENGIVTVACAANSLTMMTCQLAK